VKAAEAVTAAGAARHERLREAEAADKAVQAHKAAMDAAESSLHAYTPSHIRQGLMALSRMTERGVDGIHGPLIDLFKPLNTRYNVAVDVIAGNQLFNIVVEDVEVASAVAAELVKSKAGRVTLVPLKDISAPPVEMPKDDDVRPLMQFLRFNADHKPAIAQVRHRLAIAPGWEGLAARRRPAAFSPPSLGVSCRCSAACCCAATWRWRQSTPSRTASPA